MPASAPFRRFGTQPDDLLVDLTAPRPHAITNVLVACAVPAADRELLWDLPVGKRIECILALAALDGVESFDEELHCASCRQPFEVSFTLQELLSAGHVANRAEVQIGAARFRRPTGRDQITWLGHSYPNDSVLIAAMASTLALDVANIPMEAVEAALDDADPLLRAPVTAACPECGHEAEYETDPAAMALTHFVRAQDSLFAAVDLLASRYHWSEAEILALPEWRRVRYIQMAQREVH